MKNIWLLVILFFIVLTIVEIIKQNPEWWNKKREGFLTSFTDINNTTNNSSANMHKVMNLNIEDDIDNSEIVLHSPVSPKYKIGIEANNSIDVKIAQYFTNNIIPAKVSINYNALLLNQVETGKVDLAFVREYKLLQYMESNSSKSRLRVIMPTFNKYLMALTSANNDIEYIEDINNFVISKQIICYMNDDDLEIVKTIMKLQRLLPRIVKRISFKKISDFSEIGSKDIFIGLIVPKEEEEQIRTNKLKPIYYQPIERYPDKEKRLQLSIKVNEEDTDDIREFHYDLTNQFAWLSAVEIFPTAETQAYRTYKVRFLLICNADTAKLTGINFKTLINNWWAHRMQLKNIYNVSAGIKRGYPVISDTFTDLAAISPLLKFNDEMKIFLANKKLLSYD